MRREYDFSKARQTPYAKRLKRQVKRGKEPRMKRTIRTFAMLAKASKSALENANKDGRIWMCASCLVMAAFSLEAFLNHVGCEHAHQEVDSNLRGGRPRGRVGNGALPEFHPPDEAPQ